MQRILIVPALVLLVGATNAYADGVANGWGDGCWYSGNDNDSDGLNDSCEQALASGFQPRMWFDSGESGYGRRPYFAVKSLSYAQRRVQIFYMDSFFDDTGVTTGHDGDPEFRIAEVYLSGGVWYLDWMYMSAHRKSVCDSSAWYYHTQLLYNFGYRGRPTVFVAEDKHATYNNTSTCDAGCAWQDYCSYYAVENWDRGQGFAGRNVGQSWDKIVDYVYYDGEGEYLFSDEFAGWDDNWYRFNSNGYQQHFNDFGF